MPVFFYGEEGDLHSLLERPIRSVAAAEETLMISLGDGRDLVIWVDDDFDLGMRIEGERCT